MRFMMFLLTTLALSSGCLCGKTVETDTTSSPLQDMMMRGSDMYDQGNYQGAAQQYTTLINRIKSEDIPVTTTDLSSYYAMRGMCYYELADYRAALDDLNNAIEMNPTFAEAYLYRARIHLKLGNEEAMRQDMDKAQQLGLDVKEILGVD
ncbi:Tetratricopeptide repeat protein [uncultured archaeon]|nr:Tetratricopeptide repeat protein [uncultured archaeon]